jgi:hypothetical protein
MYFCADLHGAHLNIDLDYVSLLLSCGATHRCVYRNHHVGEDFGRNYNQMQDEFVAMYTIVRRLVAFTRFVGTNDAIYTYLPLSFVVTLE